MKGDVMNEKMPVWATEAAARMQDRLAQLLQNVDGLHTAWHGEEGRVVVADAQGTGLEAVQSDGDSPAFGYRLGGVPGESADTFDESVAELQQAWRAEPGRLTVFTKDRCPACQMTRRQFDKAGLAYMVVDLADAEPERAEFVEQGIRQAPVVEVAGQEPYGGFNPARIKDIIATTFPPIDEASPTAGRAGGGHRPRSAQHDQAQTRGRGR